MPTSAIHVWRPSSARVAVLDGFVPLARGAAVTAPPALVWAPKDPADVLDYVFDVSAALIGNDGDSIVDIDVTVTPNQPGDLVVNSAAADGGSIVFWLAAGQAGTTYAVSATIVTVGGRTLSRTVQVPVISLATNVVPDQAIKTETGQTIADQSGNPLLAV